MKEFTFVTITFNQEKYILQHLESIKFQINKYGKNIAIHLVISDDHSLDNTLQLAEKWIEKNSYLFNSYKIYRSSSNNGIVKNYLKAINKIQTADYKLLAGDDLYYKNNIFNAIQNKDILLTPTINFDNDNKIYLNNDLYLYKKCILNRNKNLQKLIGYELEYDCLIQAPGSFLKTRIVQEKQLQDFIGQFKWIEDYPQWYYLFKQSRQKLKIQISMEPYILYRTNIGISSTSHHIKNTQFLAERQKINRQFKNKHTIFPKFINPYIYIFHLKVHMVQNTAKHNSELAAYDQMRKSKNFKKNIVKYLNDLKRKTKPYIFDQEVHKNQ